MRERKEEALVYLIGSVGYGFLETLWRGFTHWTMVLTGGFCLLWLYRFDAAREKMGLFKKCFCGAGLITATEFFVGLVVNRLFRWKVWDYSQKRGNVFGQICPQYSLLWFFLCIPTFLFCKCLKKRLLK